MSTSVSLLLYALNAARAELERHASLLNQINVFPIMDGDTGSNLHATLLALPKGRGKTEYDGKQLSQSLLRGASGNSGIILAEFLCGVIETACSADVLLMSDIVAGIEEGRNRAYQAVSKPKEGTMLTIMTVLMNEARKVRSLFLYADYKQLNETLLLTVLKTPNQLPVLADAGVVDSGALGAYIVASGIGLAMLAVDDESTAVAEMSAWIGGMGGVPIKDVKSRILPDFVSAAATAGVGHRYCVNLVVETDEKYPNLDGLEALGDSINTAKSGRVMKVHIHSNHPEKVKSVVAEYGIIKETIVQDMQQSLLSRQAEIGEMESLSIRVMTDAAASIDAKTAAGLGIVRLHNYVNIAGKAVPDHHVDTAKLLDEMQAGAVFSTATATPNDAAICVSKVLKSSNRVVYIAVGDAYTPTRETVEKKRAVHPEGERMVVLSSAAASGQQGLICIAVQEFATHHSFDETVAYAKKQIEGCVEYLYIPDLTYLRRTGRIGGVKAAFARALSIKPIVGHGANGAITHCKVKSGEKAEDAILERVRAHPGEGSLLVMVEYTDNRPFAEALRDRLLSRLPADTEVLLSPLSSASVVHMGPGTWGVAVTRR